jgi:hypothetical protein
MVEEYCGQGLLLKKWKKTYHHELSPGISGEIVRIALPYPPLVEIESVWIVNGNKSNRKETKRYHLNHCTNQPSIELLATSNHIEIIYTSGYGLYPINVPATLRHGVMLVASELYEHRDGFHIEANQAIGGTLSPYRVMNLA